MINTVNKEKKIILGQSRPGPAITIPLDGQEMPNYHIQIQGVSGSGKTYALKSYALQAASLGFPVIIIDSSGSYKLPEDSKPWGFSSSIDPIVMAVYQHGIDINPFQSLQLDANLTEKEVDTAQRIAELFAQVLHLGIRQKNTLYEAILNVMPQQSGNIEYDIQALLYIISGNKDTHAKTLYSKLKSFFDQNTFNGGNYCFNTYRPGEVYIYDLQYFTDGTKQFLSDIILWNIWNQAMLKGSIDHKTFLILDEAQLFNHSKHSPIARILTEGRKHGIGLWLGTQFFHDNVSKAAINRIQQASTKLYFKPNDYELKAISKEIDPNNNGWIPLLRNLRLGECIATYTKNTSDGMRSKQILLKVPADI
ncbi:ATP-binding protein [Lacrimispora sp.]|uniref:ATP-binding protein n=1 Tax=Lacrimispora sp. TaxID=2719234 RepID=UPI0028ABA92E|nr:DUF87 domain-containing protein [Lacrimispora sp.]